MAADTSIATGVIFDPLQKHPLVPQAARRATTVTATILMDTVL